MAARRSQVGASGDAEKGRQWCVCETNSTTNKWYISCSGPCQGWWHPKCGGLPNNSRAVAEKARADGWRCEACKVADRRVGLGLPPASIMTDVDEQVLRAMGRVDLDARLYERQTMLKRADRVSFFLMHHKPWLRLLRTRLIRFNTDRQVCVSACRTWCPPIVFKRLKLDKKRLSYSSKAGREVVTFGNVSDVPGWLVENDYSWSRVAPFITNRLDGDVRQERRDGRLYGPISFKYRVCDNALSVACRFEIRSSIARRKHPGEPWGEWGPWQSTQWREVGAEEDEDEEST
jgi:hypothetical protein